MEEIINMKCNICKKENDENCHYCQNCGKNLSSQIEITDILLFISSLLKFFSIMFAILFFFGVLLANTFRSLSHDKNLTIYPLYFICLIVYLIGVLLKKYTLKKCKKNI